MMTVIPRVGTGVDVHAFGEEGTPLYMLVCIGPVSVV